MTLTSRSEPPRRIVAAVVTSPQYMVVAVGW